MNITEILASKPVTEIGKKPSKALDARNRAAQSAWYGRLSREDRAAYDAHCDAKMRAAVAAPMTPAEVAMQAMAIRDIESSLREEARPVGRISREEAEQMAEDLGDYSHHA